MTNWTDHVKHYSNQHGISYKKAMTAAKASYNPNKIYGKGLNSMLRKAKNTLNTAERKTQNTLNTAERKAQNTLNTAERKRNNTMNRVNDELDSANVVARKAKNTVNRVLKESEPLVSLISPELGIAEMGLRHTLGGKLGSGHNPHIRKMKGGSFRTASEMSGSGVKCSHCQQAAMHGSGISNPSVLSHPSFNPAPRKTYTRALKTN